MKTILILAANPRDTTPLRLGEEVRDIDDVLRRARQRENFELKQQWAVGTREIRAALLDFTPQIVHFSGHGAGEQGLAFEDDNGQVRFVDAEALAGLFRLFDKQVECVILNACYSQVQAEALARHINYVVGMNQSIGDKAAIEFAVGFYDALGAGRSYEDAYEFGRNAIQMLEILEYQTPVLHKKSNLTSFPPIIEQPLSPYTVDKIAELDKEYKFLTRKINTLQDSLRTAFLPPDERFRIEEQIQELQVKREEVTQKINEYKI